MRGHTIRALLLGAVAVTGMQAVPHAVLAADAEVTLTIHHFLGPKSTTQEKLIEPWVERVEEASGGRIAFDIFPSMSMGGKPSDLSDQVRDGTADIVWTAIGQTPGAFPRTEVFELPTVHTGSAVTTNLAIADAFEAIADDYDGMKPLLVHVHDGHALHLRESKDDITSLDVLDGMKLSVPSRTGAWMIDALGAEAVDTPPFALAQALATDALDGAVVPFEAFPSLGLADLTRTSVEGSGKLRFGTSVFVFAMNQERFDGLSEDLQKVIEDHSGRDFAREMGEVWGQAETEGKRRQFESGGTILRLDGDLTAEIETRGRTVADRWVEDVSGDEIDGQGIVDAARAAVGENTN